MKWIIGLVTCVLVGVVRCQDPVVDIPGAGTVQGTTGRSEMNNRQFYMFRGIPFANPPVGNLRFLPPTPVDPWNGVLNATRVGRACPQLGPLGRLETWPEMMSEYFDEPMASDDVEDCLYIQVYTPTLDTAAKLPVIVFYHGGAFRIGSADFYGSGRFLDEDVVLVVPHYRLGPLGFLSLHTDTIPGNAGMLDQVSALQWVRRHISVFGGDPNHVTVMGESAGGVSSSMLAVSPLSTGLFKQYIAQSGSAAADWGIDLDPVYAATEIGRLVNCSDPEVNALTACLLAADPRDLLVAHNKFQMAEIKAARPFFGGSAPVIQQAGSVRFLEQDPRELLEQGSYVHKPALLGSNKHEGTLVYAYMHAYNFIPNGLLEDADFFKRDVTNFFLDFFGVEDVGEAIAAGVEKAYFGQENMGNLTALVPGIIDYLGAMFLKGPVYDNAVFNSEFAPTYLYSFNFFGSSTLWGIIGMPEIVDGGVSHANELIYLFNFPGYLLNSQERQISRQLVKLWTNFATYGEPNPASNPVEGVPQWPVFTPEDNFYLRIDREMTLQQDYTKSEYFVARDENFPY